MTKTKIEAVYWALKRRKAEGALRAAEHNKKQAAERVVKANLAIQAAAEEKAEADEEKEL